MKQFIRWSWLLLLLSCSFSLKAQEIRGKVVDSKSDVPLSSVSVTVQNASNRKVLGGAFTGDDGSFSIKLKDALPAKVIMTYSHLAYLKKSEEVAKEDLSDLLVKLTERTETLKEVTVRASVVKQKGDTLRYAANQLAQLGDRTLEDVIKRIPGIQIDEKGRITYDGKDLAKFYIEGLDLMAGRYTQLTKNFEVDDIAAVEVLQNHEERKVNRQSSTNTQAALNVLLKEKAKNKWIYTLTAGAGITAKGSPTGLGSVVASSFGSNSQTMMMVKGNNNGEDIGSERMSFITDASVVSSRQNVSDIFSTTIPRNSIATTRGRFMTMAQGSINHIRKLNKDTQWRLNSLYAFDESKKRHKSGLDFATGVNSSKFIEQITDLKSREHMGSLESNYTYNKDDSYFLWKASGSYTAKNSIAKMSTNRNPYTTEVTAPSLAIDNNLIYTFLIGKDKAEIIHNFTYINTPQSLSLEAEQPLPDGSTHVLQEARWRGINNKISAQLSHPYRFFTFNLGINVDWDKTILGSDLSGWGTTTDHTNGELCKDQLLMTLKPQIIFNNMRHKIGFSPSIERLYTQVNQQENGKNREVEWLFLPSFFGYFTINHKLTLQLHYNYNKSTPDIYSIYDTYLFRGVNNISRGAYHFWFSDMQNGGAGLYYKNIIKLFNASYSIDWNRYSTPYASETYLEGVNMISKMIPVDNNVESWSHKASINKIFRNLNLTMRMEMSYTSSKGNMWQQGEEFDFNNSYATISPYLEWMIIPKVNLIYKLNGNIGSHHTTGSQESRKHYNLEQQFRLNASVTKNFRLTAQANHFYNALPSLEGGKAINLWFLDMMAIWKLKNVILTLDAKNLTNKDELRVTSQSNLNASYNLFSLRPMEFFLTLKWNLGRS